jgi:hypothetical protein
VNIGVSFVNFVTGILYVQWRFTKSMRGLETRYRIRTTRPYMLLQEAVVKNAVVVHYGVSISAVSPMTYDISHVHMGLTWVVWCNDRSWFSWLFLIGETLIVISSWQSHCSRFFPVKRSICNMDDLAKVTRHVE